MLKNSSSTVITGAFALVSGCLAFSRIAVSPLHKHSSAKQMIGFYFPNFVFSATSATTAEPT
jgi:hypothetical protein